ncbi:hypothetical protein B0H17DRAFT_1125712 [Mycena rosella]|uniref:Uncharacterized protein n=1 Tax=Mycena rosella TaxID=1033263 RepID=A0AAD7GWT9_MYCRO|nr:hypothetical protein B0H17DRAFT_1125712 [Mycena rosella]
MASLNPYNTPAKPLALSSGPCLPLRTSKQWFVLMQPSTVACGVYSPAWWYELNLNQHSTKIDGLMGLSGGRTSGTARYHYANGHFKGQYKCYWNKLESITSRFLEDGGRESGIVIVVHGFVCVFGGGSVVLGDSLGFGGRVKAAGNPESDRGGPGTTEPVHKGRKGTANEPQSNPSVSKGTKRDGRVGKSFRFDEVLR